MRDHPQFYAYVAFICVCIFWGTTYLGFRIALESIGPATIVCLRNLLSGLLILTFARLRGAKLPTGPDLRYTALYGVMIIGVGNVSLAIAEQWTPSGLASIFVSTAPFWYVGMDALLGGERLHAPTIAGLLVGFLGVLYLVAPAAQSALAERSLTSGGGIILGFFLLQASGATWTLGSLLQRNRRQDTHPFVIAGVQQLATGIVFLVPALLEPQRPRWETAPVAAVIYLALFGGTLGYGCYMVALSRLPLAIVSTYTYVNPAVAVTLGWLFYREPFGMREVAAVGVIFLGLFIVRRTSAPKQLRSNNAANRR